MQENPGEPDPNQSRRIQSIKGGRVTSKSESEKPTQMLALHHKPKNRILNLLILIREIPDTETKTHFQIKIRQTPEVFIKIKTIALIHHLAKVSIFPNLCTIKTPKSTPFDLIKKTLISKSNEIYTTNIHTRTPLLSFLLLRPIPIQQLNSAGPDEIRI